MFARPASIEEELALEEQNLARQEPYTLGWFTARKHIKSLRDQIVHRDLKPAKDLPQRGAPVLVPHATSDFEVLR